MAFQAMTKNLEVDSSPAAQNDRKELRKIKECGVGELRSYTPRPFGTPLLIEGSF